jgi:hypothetical protein
MIVAIIALIASLGGSAYAAGKLGKNSVGSRQLKRQAVKTSDLANNSVNGRKVANKSLTGDDIDLGNLGTVPSASSAAQASNANTVGGHGAACPGGTTLIRGICFDSAPNPAASSLTDAADACASKGGYLPTVAELYSTRNILNLGSGLFVDAYHGNTAGSIYTTIVVDSSGTISEHDPEVPAAYICAYPLVR